MTYRRPLLAVTWFLVVAACGVAGAQAGFPASPVFVAGFERFFRHSGADSAAAGRLLARELSCGACHRGAPGTTAPGRRTAPVLDDVGSRVRVDYLRALLNDPRSAQPGTSMPDVCGSIGTAQRGGAIEDLVHFLAATGSPVESAPLRRAIQHGAQLFHEVGCVACHGARQPDSADWPTSVPLPDLASKYTLPALARFLLDPLRVRPGGRMPDFSFSPQDAHDVAAFLMRDLELPPSARFTYYEGAWEKMPDFSQQKPRDTGTVCGFDIGCAARRNQFALRFEATMRVAQEGAYRFHLGSDDGGRLWIDQQLVVDEDGVHALKFGSGARHLTAGTHAVRVDYFQASGEVELQVEYEGPGVARQPLDGALVPIASGLPAPRQHFVPDPQRVARGRGLFVSLNCASCHRLGDLASRPALAPAWETLRADRGCLAREPQSGAPRYALDDEQRAALVAALPSSATAVGPSGADVLHDTLLSFDCYACHQRDGRGGVERERDAFFRSNQPEMGDEGRLPPHLDGVGAKLTEAWLRHIVRDGAKDRIYMFTRMPKFGEANIGHLVALWPQLDHVPPKKPVATDLPPRRLKSEGRLLAGSHGFSCVKCHVFGDVQSTGIQAISLTTMAQRLREDWFDGYLRDPQKYRPGTRMPSAWPEGQVLLPKVLDGRLDLQVHALWVYLLDGDHAAPPLGLEREPIELVARDEPLLYRNFIEGAGPRAIGVGYPEKVNLAFDANQLRLALVWHGAFIDASRHWTGRGAGFQPPLGDNVLSLPPGVQLAVLERPDDSWPGDIGRGDDYRFRGYRLDDRRRPTFLYEVHGVHVADYFEPLAATEYAPLLRTLTLTSDRDVPGLWFRVATGHAVEPAGEGWYVIDGQWRVQLDGAAADAQAIRVADQTELRVPLDLSRHTARIVVQYQW